MLRALSSLQALMISARALQRGTIDMAVVGGASVCHRDWLVLFSSAQSLSANASRPFDQNADGLMVAEGYVGLVIKTLDRAVSRWRSNTSYHSRFGDVM